MAYDNTNTGALFKNESKNSDRHPDYRGSINVDGVEYWLSSWLKEDRNGKKYMSLAVNKKDQQQNSGGGGFDGGSSDDLDSEIPF